MANKNIRDIITETTALVLLEHIIEEEARLACEEFSLDPRKWFKKTPSTYRQPKHPSGIPLLDQAMFDFENRENLEHMQAVAKSLNILKGPDYRAAVKAHKSGDTGKVWQLALYTKYWGFNVRSLRMAGVNVEDVPDLLLSLAYAIESIPKLVKAFERGASRWERAMQGAHSDQSERMMRRHYNVIGAIASEGSRLVKWWEKVVASPKLMASEEHLSIDNIKEIKDLHYKLRAYTDKRGFDEFERMQDGAERNAEYDARDAKYAANARQYARDQAESDRYSKMSPGEQARHRERQLPGRLQSRNHHWWQGS
jgi:hypothetical protein